MNITTIANQLISSLTTKSDNTDTNENFTKEFIMLAVVVLILSYIQNMGRNTSEDELRQQIWDSYADHKKNKNTFGMPMLDHTRLFFQIIGKKYEQDFISSEHQIIQFGISTGDFVSNLPQDRPRTIIGYDFSSKALESLPANIEQRQIDLNHVVANQPAYQDQLEKDFSVVSDVLLIRVLEYLKPEAMKLLMVAIVNASRPGSRFYVEASFPTEDTNIPFQGTFCYSAKPNTIPSFFAGRNDLTIERLDATPVSPSEENNVIERLIIRKGV